MPHMINDQVLGDKTLLYLSVVMDSVACGVILLDRELKLLAINRSAQLMTGFSEEEAVGKPCREVLKTFLSNEGCPIESVIESGHEWEERTLSIVTKQGKELPIRTVSYVMRDEEGEVTGAVQTFGDITTVHDLRVTHDLRFYFHGIVSRNHQMQTMFQIMPRLAESNSTILVRGESGTGKELVARALHALSPRADQRFIAVNCAALPDTLLEAELFGHVRGAFTDAKQDREGRIAMAEGGTLFLDEVGDISPAMQIKLLRFLQERTYEVLGSSTSKRASVRVIAATNRNLEQAIVEGRFREDFYYRLNVLGLEIPPLRDRPEDVPLLIDHFLQNWAVANKKNSAQVSPMAIKALMGYEFPGNVRELENIIERSAVLALDDTIDLNSLPDEVRERFRDHKAPHSQREGLLPANSFSPVELAEREAIRDVLRDTGGNRQDAAALLGMSRTTLWRKLKKYMLD